VSHTDVGRDNLRGEFASMTAIFQATADFVPTPIAAGTYASDRDVHFFLCSFVDMTDEVADVETLPAKLAELHNKGISPNGKYGFPVPTYQGALQQPNTWTDSWEKFFTDMISRCFNWEQDMHGLHEEMQGLFKAVIKKVIPRLLRPLETGGREIQPHLVHGDLWDGNTSTDAATYKPIIFDASSMYAHNECMWL
jgi:protein-ribulosamine 3-kinase